MSSDPRLNQRIRRALKKLSKLHKRLFWFRLLIWLAAYRARQTIAGLFVRPRSQVHWLGHRPRRRRPERAFIVIVFGIGITLLEPYEIAVWALVVGGMTACMLALHSAYLLIIRMRPLAMNTEREDR